MAATTPNYGLSKPAGTDPVDISVLNGNADIIDTALHELDEGKADQSALDELETDVGNKADQTALAALEAEVNNRIPLTPGTPMLLTETWNLFELPVGKYYRQSSVSDVLNIPSGLTVAFYCIVENTISSNRRRILLYPATASLAGVFYTCVETSSGYGSWYIFTGEVVT